MKILLFFCILSLSILKSYAQITYRFQIFDTNNKPISYASLMWNKTEGFITDSTGYAIVSPNKSLDTIFISAISYQPTAISLENISVNSVNLIKLLPLIDSLPILKIWPESNPITLGCLDNKEGFSRIANLTSFFSQEGLLINVDETKQFKLKSISVFISKKSASNIPFRIRIYNTDNSGFPSEDVLLDNIIVDNYKSGDWNEISLLDNNLKQPNNTFIIAIEWIGNSTGGNRLWIAETNKMSEPKTVIRIGNMPWKKNPIYPSDDNPTNIMLKAKIVYPK